MNEEFEAINARRKRDFDLLIAAAWHVEYFARQKYLKGLRLYIQNPGESPEVEEYMAEQTLVEEMSLGMTDPEERI